MDEQQQQPQQSNRAQLSDALLKALSKRGQATRAFSNLNDLMFSGQIVHWDRIKTRNSARLNALKRPDDKSSLAALFKTPRRRDKKDPDDEAHNPFQACAMQYTYSRAEREWTAFVWVAFAMFPRPQTLRALLSELFMNFHEHCLREDANANVGDVLHGVNSTRVVLLDAGDATLEQASLMSGELDALAYTVDGAHEHMYTRRLYVAGLEVVVYGIPEAAENRGVLMNALAVTPVVATFPEEPEKAFKPVNPHCQDVCDPGKTKIAVALDPLSVASLSLVSVYHVASRAVREFAPSLCRRALEHIVTGVDASGVCDFSNLDGESGLGLPKPHALVVRFSGPGSRIQSVRVLLLVQPPEETLRGISNVYPVLTVSLTCSDVASHAPMRCTLESLLETAMGMRAGALKSPKRDTEDYVRASRVARICATDAFLGGNTYEDDLRTALDPGACKVRRFLRYAVARHLLDHAPHAVVERGVGSVWHSAMYHWGCRVSVTRSGGTTDEWRTTDELTAMGVHVPDLRAEDPVYWTSVDVQPSNIATAESAGTGTPMEVSSEVALGYDHKNKMFTCAHVKLAATTMHPTHGVRAYVPAYAALHTVNSWSAGVLDDACEALLATMFVSRTLYEGNTSAIPSVRAGRVGGVGKGQEDRTQAPKQKTTVETAQRRQYFHPWTKVRISTDPVDLRAGGKFVSVSVDMSGESFLTLRPFVAGTAVNRTKKLGTSGLHKADGVKYVGREGMVACVLWGIAQSMTRGAPEERTLRAVLCVIRALCEGRAASVQNVRVPLDDGSQLIAKTLQQKSALNLVTSTQLGKKVKFHTWTDSCKLSSTATNLDCGPASIAVVRWRDISQSTVLEFYRMHKRASASMAFWPKKALSAFMDRIVDAETALKSADVRGWKTQLEYVNDVAGVRTVGNPERNRGESKLLDGVSCMIGDDIKELANFTPDMISALCMDFASSPFYGPNDYVLTTD